MPWLRDNCIKRSGLGKSLKEKATLKLTMKDVGMKDGWPYWEMVSTDTGAVCPLNKDRRSLAITHN